MEGYQRRPPVRRAESSAPAARETLDEAGLFFGG